MSKELFIKLSEELGRDPTDDEMVDAEASAIDAMVERKKQFYGDNMRDADVVSDALKSLRKVRGQ